MTSPRIPPYETTEPGAIVFLPEVDPLNRPGFSEDQVYDLLSGQIVAAGGVAFHLPGQHDQSTHGHGGVTGHDALDATSIRIGSDDGKAVPAGSLTGEETMALRRYRGTAYVRVNDYGRGKPLTPDDMEDAGELHGQIKSAMAKSPLKQKVTVQRGTKSAAWLPNNGEGDMTGLEFRDGGFVSTTARTDGRSFTAKGGTLLSITAPAGTGAIALSDFTDEAEILLDSGLTFRVTADRGSVNGVRHLDLEVVG